MDLRVRLSERLGRSVFACLVQGGGWSLTDLWTSHPPDHPGLQDTHTLWVWSDTHGSVDGLMTHVCYWGKKTVCLVCVLAYFLLLFLPFAYQIARVDHCCQETTVVAILWWSLVGAATPPHPPTTSPTSLENKKQYQNAAIVRTLF